jgi:hypothetical protein
VDVPASKALALDIKVVYKGFNNKDNLAEFNTYDLDLNTSFINDDAELKLLD